MFNASILNNNHYSYQIDRTINELTKNVFSKIKAANNNQINNITYELPFYWETLIEIIDKDIMLIEDLRILIWGSVVECLNNNGFITSLNIKNNEEKCHIHIQWPTSIDKHMKQLNKYKKLIKNNISND